MVKFLTFLALAATAVTSVSATSEPQVNTDDALLGAINRIYQRSPYKVAPHYYVPGFNPYHPNGPFVRIPRPQSRPPRAPGLAARDTEDLEDKLARIVFNPQWNAPICAGINCYRPNFNNPLWTSKPHRPIPPRINARDAAEGQGSNRIQFRPKIPFQCGGLNCYRPPVMPWFQQPRNPQPVGNTWPGTQSNTLARRREPACGGRRETTQCGASFGNGRCSTTWDIAMRVGGSGKAGEGKWDRNPDKNDPCGRKFHGKVLNCDKKPFKNAGAGEVFGSWDGMKCRRARKGEDNWCSLRTNGLLSFYHKREFVCE